MAITGRTPIITQQATGTTLTGSLSSDAVTGDCHVAVVCTSDTPANFTAPSGWTQMLAPTVFAANRLLAAYYRFDPPSGPAITVVTTGRTAIHCQAYGGVDSSTPIDVAAAVSAENPSAAATAPTRTTVTNGARLISAVTMDSSTATFTQPTGMTMLTQTSGGGGRASAVADETWATAGATGTRAWTSGTTALASIAFLGALRPATGGNNWTQTFDDSTGLTDVAYPALTSRWLYRADVTAG